MLIKISFKLSPLLNYKSIYGVTSYHLLGIKVNK